MLNPSPTRFQNSFQELNKAVNGDGKNIPSPLFRLQLVLESNKICFNPPFEHVRDIIHKTAHGIFLPLQTLNRMGKQQHQQQPQQQQQQHQQPQQQPLEAPAVEGYAAVLVRDKDIAKLILGIEQGTQANQPNLEVSTTKAKRNLKYYFYMFITTYDDTLSHTHTHI